MTEGSTQSPVTLAVENPDVPLDTPTSGGAGEILRWDVTERVVHWSTGILLLSLLVTGAILYVPALATAVNHRAVVEQIHVVTGLALLGPLILGVLGPWRGRLVADLRRLDRWTAADWAFFRRRRGAKLVPAVLARGKFNGGQKALAALLCGGMVVMVVTGVVMRWSPPFPHVWATGATFLHDLGFVGLLIAVLGHIALALSRPDEMKSMLTGRIPRAWAAKKAPAWLAEVDAEADAEVDAPRRARPRPPRSARPGAGVAPGS
jgi:formate dehydrogenase subunit gamma